MRTQFIGGNWKMNGNKAELTDLLTQVVEGVKTVSELSIAVFPSDVYLESMKPLLAGGQVQLGGQNHCDHEKGAYTGETAPAMLQDLGCDYVLLGHSERRHLFGESNRIVARKFALAKQHHLMPVLCIGETEIQRDIGEAEAVVREQINAVVNEVGVNALTGSVIAYEPVWAIGTGKVATAEEVQAMHAMIRAHLASYDASLAESITIIYGGSLKPENAEAIFALPDVDGGLVGGASLKADSFVALAKQLAASRVAA